MDALGWGGLEGGHQCTDVMKVCTEVCVRFKPKLFGVIWFSDFEPIMCPRGCPALCFLISDLPPKTSWYKNPGGWETMCPLTQPFLYSSMLTITFSNCSWCFRNNLTTEFSVQTQPNHEFPLSKFTLNVGAQEENSPPSETEFTRHHVGHYSTHSLWYSSSQRGPCNPPNLKIHIAVVTQVEDSSLRFCFSEVIFSTK